MLARSTNGRGDAAGVVTASDLFQLWSMVIRTKVNVGLDVVWCLKKQCDMGHKVVYIGSWITHILRNYGVFPSRVPRDIIGTS